MELKNANVLKTLLERKEELEKMLQEYNTQMQNTSNTLLKVTGAIEILQQIEESKEESVDEVEEESESSNDE
jgi:hypothetical protein|tara:strand:+ start:1416 stop:1631 length:216 start_codon:yes stop_codon:yes gene_type:complete